jgi:hypothetical protein
MDPILAEIYSTVLGAAPYVIGAYLLMWLVLFGYVLLVVVGLKRTEREMAALEAALKEKAAPPPPHRPTYREDPCQLGTGQN